MFTADKQTNKHISEKKMVIIQITIVIIAYFITKYEILFINEILQDITQTHLKFPETRQSIQEQK